MANLSYNEEHQRQITLLHLFLPTGYGILYEAVLAVLALVLFNLSTLSTDLLSKSLNTAHPLSAWDLLLQKSLNDLQQYHVVQQGMLFGLWAVAGALIYILLFRMLQLYIGARQSIGTGVKLVRQEHAQGVLHWLATLHDIFLKVIIFAAAATAIAIGVLVCFGIASQKLHDGLSAAFPASVGSYALSLVGALLSVRLIILGLCLLSDHFRNWYMG
jgi:hypothetical protein